MDPMTSPGDTIVADTGDSHFIDNLSPEERVALHEAETLRAIVRKIIESVETQRHSGGVPDVLENHCLISSRLRREIAESQS
jgi:hypothetical protein